MRRPSARSLPRSRSLTVAGAAALLAGTLVASGSALAATPGSGTLSDTSGPATWSGGPFVAANVTAQTGTVLCSAATPCDDYALTVSTPAGYDTSNQLKISISWANTAADFDLYVLDANGNEVTASASSSDPETVLLPASSASYTVRVVPFNPLGESYAATASLVAKPTNPPPATFTPPTYANYAAPESMSNAHNAGEPSIGSNWSSGATMYQAYTSTYKVAFDDTQSPPAASWSDVSANAANGCPQGSITSLDPILFTDHQTGRTFESQLAGKTALTCYSDDDGATWNPTQGSGINSGVDHQTIGGGPVSPNALVGNVGSYPNAVYYCSQDIADALCAASHDGGTTYGPAVPMYDLTQCGGLHGHVKVSPTDGTVYVPNKGCGGNQAVAVSEDGGTTWSVRPVPNSTPGDSDPSVGIGSNGTVYFGYQNSDGHPRVAVSHDHGKTWESDQDVGTAFGIQNTVFPAVVAGDDDRAAFVFIGTPTGGNYQDATNFQGVWHLYIATTLDGGASWQTVDATPNDPVQKGSICTGGTTCGSDRNLLDFIDVTVDKQGRVEAGWADGCTGACATGGPQNYDALATITRQTGGPRLFSAYDPLADLTPTAMSVTKQKGGQLVTATVRNIGAAPASGVVTSFYDGLTLLGSAAPVTLAPGQSTTVSITTSKFKYGSANLHVVVDPNNTIKESDETNNRL